MSPTKGKQKKSSAASGAIEFGPEIPAASIPARAVATKYDAVVQRAQTLEVGKAFSFQAPSTSSLTRLKKRLSDMGYRLTTQTNADAHPTNAVGVTAFVANDVGDGVAPMSA
jgi:hypothetical protein